MDKSWISVNEKLPELENDEPIIVEVLTDFDSEILEAYYDDQTWWIQLASPAVGCRDYRTFDVDFEITHWRNSKSGGGI